jgi:plasmid maintenance system antidote protein VapI
MKYVTLKEKMASRDVKIEDIASLLEIHRNSASNKVNGISRFTIDESIKVRNAFFPDLELDYLFATEEDKAAV